jgi:hypothetical protein
MVQRWNNQAGLSRVRESIEVADHQEIRSGVSQYIVLVIEQKKNSPWINYNYKTSSKLHQIFSNFWLSQTRIRHAFKALLIKC